MKQGEKVIAVLKRNDKTIKKITNEKKVSFFNKIIQR